MEGEAEAGPLDGRHGGRVNVWQRRRREQRRGQQGLRPQRDVF